MTGQLLCQWVRKGGSRAEFLPANLFSGGSVHRPRDVLSSTLKPQICVGQAMSHKTDPSCCPAQLSKKKKKNQHYLILTDLCLNRGFFFLIMPVILCDYYDSIACCYGNYCNATQTTLLVQCSIKQTMWEQDLISNTNSNNCKKHYIWIEKAAHWGYLRISWHPVFSLF